MTVTILARNQLVNYTDHFGVVHEIGILSWRWKIRKSTELFTKKQKLQLRWGF